MLLDTHVWLWHAGGDAKRIAPRARREIGRAGARGALIVSVASMFEIASLSASGRLRLVPSAEAWIRQSIELGHLQVAEVTASIAIEAGSIPPAALPDPMDRLLVATARAWAVPIATRDAAIRDYVKSQGGPRAIDVGR
jgi:PIN domain nuclease of toxin-antitoxin system